MSQNSRREENASNQGRFLPYTAHNADNSEDEWEPPSESTEAQIDQNSRVQGEALPGENKGTVPSEEANPAGAEVPSSAGEDDEVDELYNPEEDYDSEDSAEDLYDSSDSSDEEGSGLQGQASEVTPGDDGEAARDAPGEAGSATQPPKVGDSSQNVELEENSGSGNSSSAATIAMRTRNRQPLPDIELDEFDKYLPENEEPFDFGISNEDEEYNRFLAFFQDEDFQDFELFPESEEDDDEYSPTEEVGNAESDEEEEDDSPKVSHEEWVELVNNVREVFQGSMAGLQTILPKNRANRAEERLKERQHGRGKEYDLKQKTMLQMRQHLHILVETLLACCCGDPEAKSTDAKHVQLKARKRTIAMIKSLNKMYRASLQEQVPMFSSRLAGGNHRFTRSSFVRNSPNLPGGAAGSSTDTAGSRPAQSTAADNETRASKASISCIAGLHMLPTLLAICDKMHGSTAAAPSATIIDGGSNDGDGDETDDDDEDIMASMPPTAMKELLVWVKSFAPFKTYASPVYDPNNKVNLKARSATGTNPDDPPLKTAPECIVMKRSFTSAEDEILLLALKQCGRGDFKKIQSQFLQGFTPSAIEKRFKQLVDRNRPLPRNPVRKWHDDNKKHLNPWTEAEEKDMKSIFLQYKRALTTGKKKASKLQEFVDRFQKKHPSRSYRAILNKYHRIKDEIIVPSGAQTYGSRNEPRAAVAGGSQKATNQSNSGAAVNLENQSEGTQSFGASNSHLPNGKGMMPDAPTASGNSNFSGLFNNIARSSSSGSGGLSIGSPSIQSRPSHLSGTFRLRSNEDSMPFALAFSSSQSLLHHEDSMEFIGGNRPLPNENSLQPIESRTFSSTQDYTVGGENSLLVSLANGSMDGFGQHDPPVRSFDIATLPKDRDDARVYDTEYLGDDDDEEDVEGSRLSNSRDHKRAAPSSKRSSQAATSTKKAKIGHH